MKQFFECEAALINTSEPIESTVTFEELLEHPPMPMDVWVQRNANCFTGQKLRDAPQQQQQAQGITEAL